MSSDFPGVYRIQSVEQGSNMTLVLDKNGKDHRVGGFKTEIGDKRSLWRFVPVSGTKGGYKLLNIEYNLEAHMNAANNALLFGVPVGSGTTWFLRKSTGDNWVIYPRDQYALELLAPRYDQPDPFVKMVRGEGKTKNQLWVIQTAKYEEPGPGKPPVDPPTETKPPTDTKPPTECQPPPTTDDPEDKFKPGVYVIRNVATNTVIDHEGGGQTDNARIFGYEYNNGINQWWNIQPSGNGSTWWIQNWASKQYTWYNDFKQAAIMKASASAQEYIITKADKGWYIAPAELPDHVVDMTRSLTANETEICLWIRHGEDHQKWMFERREV